MAYPFGGHPKFGQYLLWARDEFDFRAQTGVAQTPDGKAETVTKISKVGGPNVVVVGVEQDEFLVPSMVGYLDRRLEVTSPFFSTDDDAADS